MEKLKDRCKTALEKIKSLNPLADSIVVGKPYVADGSSGGPLFTPASGPYGFVPPPAATGPGTSPQEASAKATISADWPSEANGLAALLLARETLKRRIRDADLAGGNDAATTPESLCSQGSPSQREAAVADAFAEAKAHATELATGVGLRRGPLVELYPQATHFYPCITQYAGIGDNEAFRHGPRLLRSADLRDGPLPPGGKGKVSDSSGEGIVTQARRAHLVGIAGAGIERPGRGPAQDGWIVSGSDVSQVAGHSACHVTPDIDLVIYSVAVGPENIELRRASRIGHPHAHLCPDAGPPHGR